MVPDAAAVACILGCLDPTDWARLMCTSRSLHAQLRHVLATLDVGVTVDCSIRSWRSMLQAIGSWCGHVSSLSLLQGSARSLHSMQLLQPLLQPHLTHLTLQGFNLSQGDCHLRHLVALLLQHCPHLEHLDLQNCELPNLGPLQSLLTHPQAQLLQSDPCQQVPLSQRSGLKVLQLTGARITGSCATHMHSFGANAHRATAAAHQQALAASMLPGSSSSSLVEVMAAGLTGGSGSGARRAVHAHTSEWGLQELHLGCKCDEVDAGWLHFNGTVTTRDVVGLLQGGCEALTVLDVCKRPSIRDDLLLYLAAHSPKNLHTLDISLTRVTPQGLLQLLQHCSQLRVLRYACRSGDDGVDAEWLSRLAACMAELQELDLSLHTHLDDAGLATLVQCRRLKKLKLARSHKITGAALQQLVQALPDLEQLRVVRCRGVNQSSLRRLTAALPNLVVES